MGKSANYIASLREKILPIIIDKVSEFEDSEAIFQGMYDLTKAFCYLSDLTDKNIDEDIALIDLDFPDELVDKVALFVLSATLYLAVMGSIDKDEVFVENEADLGFKECVDLLSNSITYCDTETLEEYSGASASDLEVLLHQRLKINISERSIDDYFKNRLYLQDVTTLEEVVEPTEDDKSKAIEDLLAMSNTQINITVKKILHVYRDLFSSAYQVVKPIGLLTSRGIASLKGQDIAFTQSYESAQIYDILTRYLGIKEETTRDFNITQIVQNYISGTKTNTYFPLKLLELAFGRCSTSNKVNGENNAKYPKSSHTTSWSAYSSNVVEPFIRAICQNTVVKLFDAQNMLLNGKYKDNFDILKNILEYLYKNLTPCLIVSNWKEVPDDIKDPDSQKSIVGFKVRVTDTYNVLPLDTSLSKQIVSRVFGNMIGDEDAFYEPVMPVNSSRDYQVVDIQHKFSPSIVNGEPLFAYTALKAIKADADSDMNGNPWDNLILGKNDDDSILVVGEKTYVSFRNNLVHYIIAGSRSGKGVMTLNITGGALASGKPIFYLDNKPDMASMFRSKALSGGRMFCINGDYDASFDSQFNSCKPDTFNWDANIPKFIKDEIGFDYSRYAPLFYLRCVMLLTSLIYVRGSSRTNESVYNALGGSDGVAIIIDEITAADAGISAILDKNGYLGRNFYSATTISDANAKNNKNKQNLDIVTEFGCYSTDLIRSLNDTMLTITGQWKLKGLVGGGTEGDVSDIFILGQELHSVDVTKKEYIPTNDNNMNRICGNPFYNYLFDLGCDAFMGYNEKKPEYMYSGERGANSGSKSATRLNATARNFAYVKNFNSGTVDTMLNDSDGGRSSLPISNSAVYFKPFLILNDALESSNYVDKDLRKFCIGAKLDFDKLKSMHRNSQGVLEPEIGFTPYIKAQCQSDDISVLLGKSYDIMNYLVKSIGYPGDCIEFVYDLRPEWLFTAQSLLNAVSGTRSDAVNKLTSKFFGSGASMDFNTDEIGHKDFNDIQYPHRESPEAMNANGVGRSSDEDLELQMEPLMESFVEGSIEQKFSTIMQKLFIKHPEWRKFITIEEREMIVQMCVSAFKEQGGN